MSHRRLSLRALLPLLVLLASMPAAADITNASLEIQGIGLSVVAQDPPVTTGIDVPTTVQTRFGGKENDQALAIEGLRAVGDLTGPGLDAPLELSTAPGHKFQIPGLSREGVYTLQNVRLMKGSELLQYATPSAVDIIVADLFKTTVEVRQLTPDEIRERGIVIDGRNFEVYEYTLSFLLRGDTVKIPFPVIIDSRTREVQLMPVISPYTLPPISTIGVGRWTPPAVIPVSFVDEPLPEEERNTPKVPKEPGEKLYVRPPIPAAIVIPNSLAVMHQFFVVQLSLQNGAPNGSTARLENVSARIRVPSQLRTATSKPAVALGQAVPLVDKVNGLTILVAQAKAEAEWSVEALKPGTHTIEIELRGTLKENGQEDVPMVARPRASVVVHDARFNIAFSHPEVVRKGIEYTTYSFITNTSPAQQTIILSNGVPPCSTAPIANVCRVDGGVFDERTIPSGETVTVEYKLRSGVTGKVFATAVHIDSEVAQATAQLHMGVSDTGIPLSPTTLIMPHYAQYVSESLVAESMQILGLGYSLATAPVTAATAKQPRVIKSDVYRRAVDIAQAGQHIFLANDAPGSKADAIAALSVDLLGNLVNLSEWDTLRRQQKYARPAGAAVTRELEATGFPNGTTYGTFIDNFGKALSHRDGYVAALVHGPKVAGNARPYALSVRGMTSNRRMDIPAEAESGWIRDLPYGELTRISAPGSDREGELALVGRWTDEELEVIVTPSVDGMFDIELLYPNTTDGSTMRAHVNVNGTAGIPVRVPLSRGATTINALTPSGGFADSETATVVPLETLRVVGMRQDLYLDENGHKVSILFNRPVAAGTTAANLRTKFHGEIDFNKDGVVWMDEPRPISGAALQESGRVIDLTFDHVLTTNADYTIEIDPLLDPRTTLPATFLGEFVPKIDNDRPAGIIYGRFIRGDNTPLGNHEVILFGGIPNPFTYGAIFEEFENPKRRLPVNPFFQPPQIATTRADGSYLFEFVRRDLEAGFSGEYRLWGTADNLTKYTYINGTVRLPARVTTVNLQLLGRGSAEGTVRYDNGEIAKKVNVTVGSTAFEGVRNATTDDNGFYRVEDLPVGPLAFTATDGSGNIGYAAGEIATPGEIEQQDISIYRQPIPKNGSVHGTIRRSDTGAPVMGASVGIFNNGYPLQTLTTDADGHYTAEKVPAGFISVVAAEWTVSRQSANTDFDLRGDESRQVDLTLSVAPNEQLATVTGEVLREDPLFPGNASKYQRVAGALVKIDNMRIVTADAEGRFVITDVPLTPGGRNIGAHDPATRRTERVPLPQLTGNGTSHVPILLKGLGQGTIRAKLFDARGLPVSGFEMLVKAGGSYFVMNEVGNGVYELDKMGAGGEYIVRTGSAPEAFGDQEVISPPVRVAFDGQVVSVSLRLPGQGQVRVKVKGISIPSDGGEPILTSLISDVTLTYTIFNSATLQSEIKEILGTTNQNGLPGEAIFPDVPALRQYNVSSNHPLGSSGASGRLAFDADLGSHTLTLSNLGHIMGTVYAIDGVTPVPGATIRMDDEHQDQGVVTTGLDGKFEFRNVAPGARIHLVAESTQAGVYRTGERWTATPGNGGIVNASVTLLERGQIEGKIVYGAYKVYDPLHPENNVPDNTPSDLSDNAPVPMARFWMRELDFPRRDIGTGVQPLNADLAGRFAIGNVFVGRLRATAWDPSNPDLRGDWTATLVREGELLTPYIAIGGGGTGAILAKVTNPNQNNAPVENAEVQLFRGGLFDVASSGPDGTVRFEQLPVGTYVVSAYSKALGKSGRAPDNVIVTTDTVTEARVMLTFSGQVTGRLTDPESTPQANKPVPGSHVTISMAEGFQQRFTTTALGEYLFEGVREGLFTLDAKDTASNRRAKATYLLTAADPEPVVNLELERTETLHLAVYLPDDLGGNSGVLAGPVEASVKQRFGEFQRAQQGNPIVMSKLFLNEYYDIEIQELGGDRRQLFTGGRFPKGSASQPISLVYPAYGSGEVLVRRLGAAVQDARVSIRVSKYDTRVFYSDAAGRVFIAGLPLGKNYSVTVTTLDGSSGSGNLEIIRTSVTGSLTVEVGSRATVTGKVLAEKGGPSVGTPVVINFSGGQLTATTDHEGSFTFAGVAAPSGIELRYYGDDGSTLGRLYTFTLGAQWAGQVYTVPTVTLDATPPLLLDIAPAQGAGAVPPDTHLKFVFSEKINTATVHNDYFYLQPADGSPRVNASFSFADGTNGTFIVTMVPPAPPAGQAFPLKSNTLYRLTVSQHVRDLTGHPLGTDRGLTFTTADYVEPRVIATVPEAGTPIPEQITYEFRFNEPLDPAPFVAGGAGRVQLDRMSGPEENATVVQNIPGDAYIDPFTGISLFFAPSLPTLPNSFYRIKFSGVRDLQGNVVPEQTYRLVSYDTFKPFVILTSPVPGDASLVSGLTYKLLPDIRNGDANGTPALDIDFVDYFRVENGVETFIKRVKKTPFAYDFVAPDAPVAGLTLTFRAMATDTSVNESTKTELSLTVKPNQPPVVSVALDRTTNVYAGERVNATITATDEVLTINLQLDVKATRTDGSEYRNLQPFTLQRAKLSDPWPTKTFAVDLPVNLKGGTPVTFTGIATDMSGLSTSSMTPLTLTVDTVAPSIVSITPADRAEFSFHSSYKIAASVTDVGTGVASVTFNVDGTLYTVQKAAAVGTTFTSPSIPVVAHSVDTIVPITVTATDNSGNSFSQSFEVVYLAVTDLGLPVGEWLCPISGAMLPANANDYQLKLRFRAVDETSVNSVRFRIPGVETLVVPTNDAPNEYAATVTIDTPAADTPDYFITAIVDDGDPEHTQEFRLRLSFVVPDLTVDSTQAITASNLATYEDKTVVVTGTEGRLVPHVPVRFKNLIVQNGARIETLPTTTSIERKLDMTVTGTLSIDCASTINVTGFGYLGANAQNADGSGTGNTGEFGRTLGNTSTNGAKSAGASHGGVGVVYNVGATNAVYGSYTEPRTLGAGGGSNSNSTGANGGGAIAISGSETSRFVIAGSIRADGKNGAPLQGAGAGGSVLLQSADIAISRSARVTANGGDGIPAGGGRVALYATRALAMPDDTVQARGGYNAHGEGFGYADGGAGTLYIVRPGENAGETESELRISAFNEAHPTSTHQLLPTPLGTVNGPELVFGSIFVGPRAMLRIDSAYSVTKTDGENVDPAGFLFGPEVQPALTFTTTPADGSNVWQNAQIAMTYNASSGDGVGQVFISLPGRTDQVETFGPYPQSVGPRDITLSIPANATAGPITAKVRVLTRSLRTIEKTAT
ncbi:MAG TPA: carboxypeptidase regulatory-like domain-containing protein, partial [Thermoanaerobaculia bacterium]|nr:carboxypeptidase regulatory-like domain-containing protein [Thermoanaerobaculia bacterium]